jgi:hypothetical protein
MLGMCSPVCPAELAWLQSEPPFFMTKPLAETHAE